MTPIIREFWKLQVMLYHALLLSDFPSTPLQLGKELDRMEGLDISGLRSKAKSLLSPKPPAADDTKFDGQAQSTTNAGQFANHHIQNNCADANEKLILASSSFSSL